MIALVIVSCEIGFWVLLAAGLIARYALHLPRLSTLLLISVPVTDVVLLTASTLDLVNGATATAAHGLAAAYIAYSVIYGHHTVRSIDARVAHRFAGGPAVPRATPTPHERVQLSWTRWLRGLGAGAIAAVLLLAAIVLVNTPPRTAELSSWLLSIAAAVGIWLLAGPIWTTIAQTVSQPRAS